MKPHSDSKRWVELDVLRTSAIVLMILNHTAVRAAPDPGTRLIDLANWVGSMAPVVFFFLTGLGNGVQSTTGKSSRAVGWYVKIAVLLAADALLWVNPTRWIGLDFLGFIAISALLLKELARLPRSELVAAAAVLFVAASRFLLGPLLRSTLEGTTAAALIGLSPSPGLSYPPAPWLAYPLLGYLLGRLASRRRDVVETHRGRVATTSAVGGLVAIGSAIALVLAGATFHRWGTVSFAFFLASLGAVGVAVALATLLGQRRLAKLLSMEAQQSFAVVPMHFAVLAVLDAFFGKTTTSTEFVVRTIVVLTVSVAGAVLISRISAAVRKLDGRWNVAFWVLIPAGCAAAIVYLGTTTPPPPPTSTLIRATAQLGLCLLLGLPVPGRSRVVAQTKSSPGDSAQNSQVLSPKR